MPLYLAQLPVIANGNINPSVFVTIDPTRDNAVIQASGNNFLIGIAQAGTLQAPGLQQALFPGTTPSTQYAAQQGDELEIFFQGDVCGLVCGSGTINPGDLLGNDGNGNALTVAPGSGKIYGAVSFSGGAPGDILTVLCLNGKA